MLFETDGEVERRVKKWALALAIFVLALASFADDATVYRASALIQDGLAKNFPAIRSLAPGLSEAEREGLYVDNESSATLPSVANLVVGFGLGSYIQGDRLDGSLQLAAELGSLALVIFGAGFAYNATSFSLANDSLSVRTDSGAEILGGSLLTAGIVGVLVDRVLGVLSPFGYARAYNARLRAALLSSDISRASSPE